MALEQVDQVQIQLASGMLCLRPKFQEILVNCNSSFLGLICYSLLVLNYSIFWVILPISYLYQLIVFYHLVHLAHSCLVTSSRGYFLGIIYEYRVYDWIYMVPLLTMELQFEFFNEFVKFSKLFDTSWTSLSNIPECSSVEIVVGTNEGGGVPNEDEWVE